MKIVVIALYIFAASVYLIGSVLLFKSKTESNNTIVLGTLSFIAGFVFAILAIVSISLSV